MPGSDAQTKCEAGSVAPRKCSTPPCSEGAAKCDLCEAGKYQDESGEEDCKACEPGHFCEEGAPVPTACKAGTYSNRTDLGSQAECSVTAKGNYSTQGSTEQTQCSPGTHAPEEGMGMCQKCEGGKYQPDKGASECLECELGHYCKEGASRPVPCPEKTYADTQDREEIYNATSDSSLRLGFGFGFGFGFGLESGLELG